MRLLTFALLVSFSTAASAEIDSKGCILAAAEIAPRIPGMTIDQSSTRALPAAQAAQWTHNSDVPVIVDLNVTAAGQKTTYSYLCAMVGGKPRVQRLAQ